MSQSNNAQIPASIAALLEPISRSAPTGVESLDTVEAYVKLEGEISKPSPKYADCIAWATEVLQKHSKNTRVAALLALAWYRTEKLPGLKNGLLLMAGLFERFGDKLHPANSAVRSKDVKFLSNDKITKFLLKENISSENAPEVIAAQTALHKLVTLCRQQFPQNGPDLSVLNQIIEDHAKIAGAITPDSSHQPTAGSDQSRQPDTSDPSNQRAASNAQPATSNLDQATGGSAKADAQPTISLPQPELEIPDAVKALLKPISAAALAGKALAHTNDEDYLKLQREIKQTKPKYEVCIDLATDLLKKKTKDAEIICWLTFAWYRKEGIAGLKNGLLLLLKALQQFSGTLYPSDAAVRGKAFNFLNLKKVGAMLKNENLAKANAETVLVLQRILEELAGEFERQFEEKNRPSLKDIAPMIETHAEAAKELLNPATSPPVSASPVSASFAATAAASMMKSSSGSVASAGASSIIASRDSALRSIVQALLYFFEEEKDGQKIRKVCEEVSIYGLSRQLRWGALGMPEIKEKDGLKQAVAFEGPNAAKREALRSWFQNNEWDKLIPDIEIKFITDSEEGFRYWLDGQRYVVLALEQKGEKTKKAAQEIKFQLARLMQRLPDLPKLVFKGKSATPFADTETLKWLEDEVKGIIGAGRAADKILPPIMGEDYEPIAKAYAAACAELPENFEKNVESMQKSMASEDRRKGRFLRSLNLANFCYAAKKPELAKAMLLDLIKRIEEYQLAEWEPALCVAVWQSTYLTNLKLLQSENHEAQKPVLQQQQTELFAKISKHDVLRALDLANRQS